MQGKEVFLMRDWNSETENRVRFIREVISGAGAKGVIFANSGGKDCSLVGILCRMATENVLSLMLPCGSSRNYGQDMEDARALCETFSIENRTVDLTPVKTCLLGQFDEELPSFSEINIAPRLRMTALYALGTARGYLVAGTGNRSERYMGYFTKWGDGDYDFNPIADLTATEVFEFLRFLGAPGSIIGKAPSAGLYEGQTDEADMGVTYAELDRFLLTGEAGAEAVAVIGRAHELTEHKRSPPKRYGEV